MHRQRLIILGLVLVAFPAAAAPTADKLLKVGTNGSPAAGWGTGGVAAIQIHPSLVSADGAGGAYVFDQYDGRILAVHVTSSGTQDAGPLTLGAPTSLLQGVTLDAKGRVVLLTSQKGALIAYRFANGKLDASFNGGGAATVTIPTPAVSKQTGSVAIGRDSSGRVVIAGSDDPSAHRQVFVVRLTESGSIDPSFAQGVALGTNANNAYDVMRVAVDSTTGKVTVIANKAVTGGVISSGAEVVPGSAGIALFRFDGSGMVDTKFGTHGSVLLDDQASGALDAYVDNGTTVVGGYTGTSAAGMKPVMMRWSDNGVIDSSFGSGGKQSFAVAAGTTLSRFRRVMKDGSGRIVAVTAERTPSGTPVTSVARFTANGQPDTTFGKLGIVSFNVQAAEPEIDPQGSVFFRAP